MVKQSNKSKEVRGDKLAALRQKLLSTDRGGGGAGWWSPQEGRNIIRILPPVGDMEYFFQTVGRHDFPPDGKKHAYCPTFTSEGEYECPVCDLVSELYKAGDDASKKLASSLNKRRMYWMNVIDRSNPDAGPKIYTPGVTVFNDLVEIINDPEYGDIIDPLDGFDVKIVRKGSGFNTEYTTSAVRNPSPLSEDQDEVDKWLNAARDLSYVMVSDDPSQDSELSKGHAIYILPYDRLSAELGLEDMEIEEDEDEGEPAPKSGAKKPAARTPVIEEDEDEDYEGDEDEEEDEDEEGAKREVQNRMARRSIRR